MKYIIVHDKLGILSDIHMLSDCDDVEAEGFEFAHAEWNGHYNDEGGYYSGALICDNQRANEIVKEISGCQKRKVKEVIVYMDDYKDDLKNFLVL